MKVIYLSGNIEILISIIRLIEINGMKGMYKYVKNLFNFRI